MENQSQERREKSIFSVCCRVVFLLSCSALNHDTKIAIAKEMSFCCSTLSDNYRRFSRAKKFPSVYMYEREKHLGGETFRSPWMPNITRIIKQWKWDSAASNQPRPGFKIKLQNISSYIFFCFSCKNRIQINMSGVCVFVRYVCECVRTLAVTLKGSDHKTLPVISLFRLVDINLTPTMLSTTSDWNQILKYFRWLSEKHVRPENVHESARNSEKRIRAAEFVMSIERRLTKLSSDNLKT